jgi:hypothetical protein
LQPGLNRALEPPRVYLPPVVYKFDENGYKTPWFGDSLINNSDETFCPRLYTSPPPYPGDGIVQNEDMFSKRQYKKIIEASAQLKCEFVFFSWEHIMLLLTKK